MTDEYLVDNFNFCTAAVVTKLPWDPGSTRARSTWPLTDTCAVPRSTEHVTSGDGATDVSGALAAKIQSLMTRQLIAHSHGQ